MLEIIDFKTLAERRNESKLIHLYKIVNNLVEINTDDILFPRPSIHNTRGHQLIMRGGLIVQTGSGLISGRIASSQTDTIGPRGTHYDSILLYIKHVLAITSYVLNKAYLTNNITLRYAIYSQSMTSSGGPTKLLYPILDPLSTSLSS